MTLKIPKYLSVIIIIGYLKKRNFSDMNENNVINNMTKTILIKKKKNCLFNLTSYKWVTLEFKRLSY